MNCFQITNLAGGFAAQHGPMCCYQENGQDCITKAVAHARFSGCCLNVCQVHAEKLGKRKDCQIENQVVIET